MLFRSLWKCARETDKASSRKTTWDALVSNLCVRGSGQWGRVCAGISRVGPADVRGERRQSKRGDGSLFHLQQHELPKPTLRPGGGGRRAHSGVGTASARRRQDPGLPSYTTSDPCPSPARAVAPRQVVGELPTSFWLLPRPPGRTPPCGCVRRWRRSSHPGLPL